MDAVTFLLTAIGDALAKAASMGWQILWPLILGFALSAVIQAVVRRERVTRMLSNDRPKALAIATGLGRRRLVVLLCGRRARSSAVPQGRARSPPR